MKLKFTIHSILLLLFAFSLVSNGYSQTGLGSLRGQIFFKGDPVAGVKITLYSSSFDEIGNIVTPRNGEFVFNNIQPGEYKVFVDKTLTTEAFDNEITITTETKVYNIDLKDKVTDLGQIEKTGAKKKETANLEKTTTSTTIDGKSLVQTGIRSGAGVSAFSAGVTTTRGGGISGRGSRTDGTAVFVDGVRVNNSSINQGMNGQTEVMQAGVPAQYGDFTGLGISITTKGGVSGKKSGGLEARSSSMFNPYHLNLFEVYYSTPILFKTNPQFALGKSDIRKIPIAAMNISGNFNYNREPSPSFIGYQVVKPDVLNQLEQNPLRVNPDGGLVSNASYLNENDFNNQRVRPNVYLFSSAVQAKFDFRLSDMSTLSVFSNLVYTQQRSGGNNILAHNHNPMSTNTYNLSYVRFIQNFKGPDSLSKATKTTLNNTFFSARFDYQSTWIKNMDFEHRDNLFDYGYIGQFKHYPTEFFSYFGNINNPSGNSRKFVDQNGDTVFLRNAWEQTGFRDTSIRFTKAGINQVRGNYTQSVFDRFEGFGVNIRNDQTILQSQGLLNGFNPANIYSLWNAPGTMLSGYGKSQNERYTLFAMGETEIKGPQNKSKRTASGHKLQFGVSYEQVVTRSFSLNANNLWRIMNQFANNHISNLDLNNPILSYDANGIFQDTIRYNRLVNTSEQSTFDRNFRNKLINAGAVDVYGKKIDERTFLDINSYKPSDFSIDMFSADELLNNGSSIVNYSGYDHKGNKLRGRPSLGDFLDNKEKRSVGAFMPILTAAWFQDQFFFKSLEFRIGLRVERYDANQSILKDPYSLYPIRQAGEVNTLNGNAVSHPSNIGEDYAVYVDDVKNPLRILGYRKDDNWYDENGTLLASPDLVANRTSNGKVAPYLVDPNRQEVTKESFKDFKPKVNILPRIFFKFPLNDKSLFFASFDVLSQRPTASFATVDDYVFLNQRNSGEIQNPALTPRITTDYQIGYRQQVSNSVMLSFISYYRETKNDVSLFQFNNAYPLTYISYNNLDFSSVKGLILEAEYKSERNLTITGNYTLQFADGTGSNINSQRALIASNQPNLRTLFPLGELDIRHQLKAIINWGFGDDGGTTTKEKAKRKYFGPIIGKYKIFQNTNFNLSFVSRSGLPYTATLDPVQAGSANRSPIKGTPFGSRLPWQLVSNLNIQRDFPLNWNDKNGKSKGAYVQVYYFVTNLFNRANISSVNSFTGAADDDGFINSPQGQQALQNQLNAQAYSFYYRTAVNNPGNYEAPRLMYLGARFFF